MRRALVLLQCILPEYGKQLDARRGRLEHLHAVSIILLQIRGLLVIPAAVARLDSTIALPPASTSPDSSTCSSLSRSLAAAAWTRGPTAPSIPTVPAVPHEVHVREDIANQWCGQYAGVLLPELLLDSHDGYCTPSRSPSRWPDPPSLLARSLLPRDPSWGCFSVSFLMTTYSFSMAKYFFSIYLHGCSSVRSKMAWKCLPGIRVHLFAPQRRASWLTLLVRLNPCHSREPLAYMHPDSCARVSVLAICELCCSACLC